MAVERPTMFYTPHPDGSNRYAAADPVARYVEGRVCKLKFEALLHPYRNEGEARAALTEACKAEGGGA